MELSIGRGIVRLGDLKAGSLFLYDNDLILKTDYEEISSGYIECYIIGNGELFEPEEAKSPEQLLDIYVQPVHLRR